MAYGLPANGELNWDVKLNASIEAVKATADAAVPATEKGAANGVATLGADGKVPAAQLAVEGTASSTTFTPAGNIAATNVQAAIQELDTEKETPAGAQAKVDAHTAAADPHGDRAYADSAVAAADVVPYLKAAATDVSVAASVFTKLALSASLDNMAGWDAANSEYVVPESGLYLLTGSLRVADTSPAGTPYGFGIHTATGDGTHFLWHAVQDTLNTQDRTTYPYARVLSCAAGARLRAFTYHEHTTSLTFRSVEMTITRLGAI